VNHSGSSSADEDRRQRQVGGLGGLAVLSTAGPAPPGHGPNDRNGASIFLLPRHTGEAGRGRAAVVALAGMRSGIMI